VKSGAAKERVAISKGTTVGEAIAIIRLLASIHRTNITAYGLLRCCEFEVITEMEEHVNIQLISIAMVILAIW